MQIIDCPRCGESSDAAHRHCPACGWTLRQKFERRAVRLPRLRRKDAVPWWRTRSQLVIGLVCIAGLIAYLIFGITRELPGIVQEIATWIVIVVLAAVVIAVLFAFIGKVVESVVKHADNQERMIRRLDRIHAEMAKLNAAIDQSRKKKEA